MFCLRGAVAQLGERLNGIEEVRGSNPLSSTEGAPPDSRLDMAKAVNRRSKPSLADSRDTSCKPGIGALGSAA